VRVVAYNGNLLLNIGPEVDGRIPLLFQERLRAIGAWLSVNGEAIFETSYWPVTQRENSTLPVYYTRGAADPLLYAIFLAWPEDDRLVLEAPALSVESELTLLGHPTPLAWQVGTDGTVTVQLPRLSPHTLPCDHAWTVRLTAVANLGAPQA
jgi:alpha-L-fucosidase